jgi:Membrane bound O-acyl transferase family
VPQSERLEEVALPSPKWWEGWGPLLLLPAAVTLVIPPAWPRWALMWSLAFVIYAGCKWLTWRRTPTKGVPLWRHAGYLLAWPGLDAAAFLNPHPGVPSRRPSVREWLFAASKFALGVSLLFGVLRWIPTQFPYVAGWVGMIGIVMVLHFGTFHLLSCGWRHVGVDAKPLMHWPLAAVSVSEFWGRRWNTAFRDLTHRFLFRPLSARLGPRWAICAGFVFSGVVHDFVISVPAGGGYGGPSLFFALQGAALLTERTTLGRQIGLGQGWRGWLFTMIVLLAPVCALFHPPFVLEVVVPFLRALGAV